MIISSKKYACETCIKGHRSSSCRHTDRALFEIKKKGRPVTQCEHCRELRKTKQVHVKCVCETKSSDSQGYKSSFEHAAFPNGLPEALEASVAFQNSAEPSSSDSDHGGVIVGSCGGSHQCNCKKGDPCKCAVPKTKSRKKSETSYHGGPGPSTAAARSRGLSCNAVSNAAIMKRIAELRPVLPRPPATDVVSSSGGPVHIPSSSSNNHHAHPQRHHRSVQAPYELAYGMTHQHPLHHQSYMVSHPPPHPPPPTFSTSTSAGDQVFAEQMSLIGMNSEQWAQQQQQQQPQFGFDNLPFPSLCGCGEDCSCPDCLHHNNRVTGIPASSSAYASCTNPGACGTCLDCTIMSLPASALLRTDDTALSIPIANGAHEPVAEWLRQVSDDDFTTTDPTTTFQQQQQQNFILNNGFSNHQNPTPALDFVYGSPPRVAMTSFANDGRPSSVSIDPRLLRRTAGMITGGGCDPRFLVNVADPSRSRSPSTSSQSSQQGSEGHLHHNNNGGGGVLIGHERQRPMFLSEQQQGQGRRVPLNGSASSLPTYGSWFRG